MKSMESADTIPNLIDEAATGEKIILGRPIPNKRESYGFGYRGADVLRACNIKILPIDNEPASNYSE